MKTLEITKKDIHHGHLILVNKQNPIHEEYSNKMSFLVPVDENHEDIYLESRPAVMLSQLLKVCDTENAIVPVSGYRSLKEQKQIFNDSLRDNGKAFTLQFVALPNCSEHQTGLAIDLAEQRKNIDFIRPDFPYSGVCQQFREKMADFGFIERYPKGKENITGISHEPWHFRYVGYPHSRIIQESNFTLEEYIDFLKTYPYQQKPLHFHEKTKNIEISYAKISNDNSVSIELPDDRLCQLSGNNVDGSILTVWG